MTAAASAGGLLPTRALFHESWKWLRKNWIRTLVFSLLSFVIAWGWNVWIMARKLEGSVAEPGSSTTATAQGHTWNGVYWLLCTTILFGLITYGREKGFKNLLREFFTPPFTFFDNLVRRPRSTIAMGCWGAALALLVGSVVSNAVSGLLGLGFLLAAPTALAIVLNNVLIRGWTGIFSAMQPRLKHDAAALANPYAMMFGEAIGALIACARERGDRPRRARVDPHRRLVRGRRGRRRQSAAEPDAADPAPRYGHRHVEGAARHTRPRDDGGWSECATANGDPCSSLSFFRGWWEWRKSAGADIVIRQGRVGGTFSALGCLLGCLLGGGLAAVAAAFSSASTGGLGSGFAQLSPPGGTPPAGAPPAGAAHGVGSALSQPPQPGSGLPQPGAAGTPAAPGTPVAPGTPTPHGVGQPLASSGTPGAGAASGGPPAPSPVARAGNIPTTGQPPPPPPPPGAPHGIAQGTEALHGHAGQPADVTPTGAARIAPDVTPGSAGAPHGIAQGTEGLHGHAGQPADVTPTGAARTAPDVTPGSAPGAGAPPPGAAPHGIAQGTEALHGHAGQPADVTPTGAGRHAPDVTPGHPGQGADVAPTGATRGAPDVTPTGAGRHAPDVTPGHPGQASDISPTGATRGAPDVAPHPGGAAQPPTPPPGQQPPTPGRHMLDDVLPDEDKFDEEDGESGDS